MNLVKMPYAIFEVNDEWLRVARHEGLGDPLATLSNEDLIAIRSALATVSHKGDRYSKAWHKLQKATDKAMEGDR